MELSETKVEISKFDEVYSSLSCNDLGRAGFYDYGFRDYDPVQMRFTTVDPIKSGLNWYAYVNNDPVNFIDPLGLTSEEIGGDGTLPVEPTVDPLDNGIACAGCHPPIVSQQQRQINKGSTQILAGLVTGFQDPIKITSATTLIGIGIENIATSGDPDVESIDDIKETTLELFEDFSDNTALNDMSDTLYYNIQNVQY